jgi:hypothetical protein
MAHPVQALSPFMVSLSNHHERAALWPFDRLRANGKVGPHDS